MRNYNTRETSTVLLHWNRNEKWSNELYTKLVVIFAMVATCFVMVGWLATQINFQDFYMTYYYEPVRDIPSSKNMFHESASLLPLPLLQPIHDHYSRYKQRLIPLICEFIFIALCYLYSIFCTPDSKCIGIAMFIQLVVVSFVFQGVKDTWYIDSYNHMIHSQPMFLSETVKFSIVFIADVLKQPTHGLQTPNSIVQNLTRASEIMLKNGSTSELRDRNLMIEEFNNLVYNNGEDCDIISDSKRGEDVQEVVKLLAINPKNLKCPIGQKNLKSESFDNMRTQLVFNKIFNRFNNLFLILLIALVLIFMAPFVALM